MRRSYEMAILRGIGEGFIALALRPLAVAVEFDSDGRIDELHRRDVHQIPPQHQRLAFTFDVINVVPGRVAVRRDRAHAGNELGVAAERF